MRSQLRVPLGKADHILPYFKAGVVQMIERADPLYPVHRPPLQRWIPARQFQVIAAHMRPAERE
jgi:hypothetical protein